MADADSRTGHRFATPDILAWVDRLHAGHDPGLAQAFDAACIPAPDGLLLGLRR